MQILLPNNQPPIDIDLDDTSYRHRAIMGEDTLTLNFSSAEHVEIPVGSYCLFQGVTYTVERPEHIKMIHTRHFSYTLTMMAPEAKTRRWKMRNTIDGRLRFPLTARPKEHLQMLIDNLNKREEGWSIGTCIDAPEQLISYDHSYCLDALAMLANTFKTEYEIEGKRISLCKVEAGRDNPLPLSYGRGRGFKSGVGRTNAGDKLPVEILYTQGGERNIDPSRYGGEHCLLLPKAQAIKYDGTHFEGEPGYNPALARIYISSADGLSLRRGGKPLSTHSEDSLDCSDIYPHREGQVTDIITVDETKHFYDICDNTIPESLDYAKWMIEGETMTIHFQTGMLAGRDFDLSAYVHLERDGKKARRFCIVPAEMDGVTMPGGNYLPARGDRYAIYGVTLPDSYICDNTARTGASWDMMRKAARYFYENEDEQFTFTGELDGIWAKRQWATIGGKLRLGGYIRFTDEHFARQGVLVRITGIKQYINNPYAPVIELSNTTTAASVASTLKELQAQEVVIDQARRDSIQYARRRWRDARTTMQMIEEAMHEGFTERVSPITAHMMALLVGDESLQFRFLDSFTLQPTTPTFAYQPATKDFTATAAYLQHLTLGIKDIRPAHSEKDAPRWYLNNFTSAPLDSPEKPYYLYACCERGAGGGGVTPGGFYTLQPTPKKHDNTYYYFLVGILNAEVSTQRSFVPLYGYTEVLPGRITTDRIVSADGESYFDMAASALRLGSALDFNSSGDGRLRLRGTIVQSQSGDTSYIGCYRGVYASGVTYYNGDEVSYTTSQGTSTYRHTGATPSTSVPPTNAQYWTVIAQGQQGTPGKDGADGQPGKDGANGEQGNYVELRFAKNGSPTVPPPLTTTAEHPAGWTTATPATAMAEYLWMTQAVKAAAGTLLSTWATPTRITGNQGTAGKDAPPTHPNLLRESAFATTAAMASVWGDMAGVIDGKYMGCGWYGPTADPVSAERNILYQDVAIEAGKWYTLSFMHKDYPLHTFVFKAGVVSILDTAAGVYIDGVHHTHPSYLSGDARAEWGICHEPVRHSYAFRSAYTGTARVIFRQPTTEALAGKPFRIAQPKLEEGQEATAWEPYAAEKVGKDGQPGKDGHSPACPYRGEYDPTKTYYGTPHRLDCVHYGNAYYIARIDAGEFSGVAPTDTARWNPFGATFDSVATQLLLAENANIAGWIFRGGVLSSQNNTSVLDGRNGNMFLNGFILRRPLFIDAKNIAQYTVPSKFGSTRLDISLSLAGTFIVLNTAPTHAGKEVRVRLPSNSGTAYDDNFFNAAQYIGQTVIIINNQATTLSVEAYLRRATSSVGTGAKLAQGEIGLYTCEAEGARVRWAVAVSQTGSTINPTYRPTLPDGNADYIARPTI